jgi:O-acetyl-ADP-ribose deacetylase (regulator of RNase III)
MIFYEKGDMFAKPTMAYVNPVNCIGVSGKGLAAVFKQKFPDNEEAYVQASKEGLIKVGKVFLFERKVHPPVSIFNFPTKKHWKNPSELSYIEEGLVSLLNLVASKRIESISVPALGCGLGGLSWEEVKPLLVQGFSLVPYTSFYLFEPL